MYIYILYNIYDIFNVIYHHCLNELITLVDTGLQVLSEPIRVEDIAKYVGEGNVDIGITGLDVVKESNVEVNKIMDLGFGGCRLCVQAPIADNVTDVSTLAGGRIVTSFPHLTEQFFKPFDEAKGVKTKITEVSGSVEAACGLGLADAVVDLVETGTTMKVSWPVVSTWKFISSFHSSIFSTIGCWIGSGW